MRSPKFADYHRTVIGYHGTKRSVAEAIVLGAQGFASSVNDHDWLGHGVYFWEYAPQQAWRWAHQRAVSNRWTEEVAVVASMIRLGCCLDLLDPENVNLMKLYHDKLREEALTAGRPVPKNVKSRKRLDCAVFQYAYAATDLSEEKIQTARAVYVPSNSEGRAWDRSWINSLAHIQLCVRDSSCILGTWLVKPIEEATDAGVQKPTVRKIRGDAVAGRPRKSQEGEP